MLIYLEMARKKNYFWALESKRVDGFSVCQRLWAGLFKEHEKYPYTKLKRCPPFGERVTPLGIRVLHWGNHVPHSGNQVPHSGNRVPNSGNRVLHMGIRVPLSGNQVLHSGKPYPILQTGYPSREFKNKVSVKIYPSFDIRHKKEFTVPLNPLYTFSGISYYFYG